MNNINFKKRILFLGVPDMGIFALEHLTNANVNIVGVLGPLKTHNTFMAFKNYTISKGLNFIDYDRLDDKNLINKINELKPDIAVVCSFNTKIPKIFLDSIPHGVINVHPSLLPKYRGGNPYSKVIANGEEKTGVTLHFMSEDFDKGDIIAQQECEISPVETMGTIFEKTNIIACDMLLKAIIYFEKHNTLPRQKQPEGEFIKAKNYSEKEQFINYETTAQEIERFVRGLNPYLTAYTIFRNQIIKIHKVSIVDFNENNSYPVGTICKIDGDKLYIKTKQGYICPEVMQYTGLFIGNCKDFIEIVKPKIGEKFINV